VESSCRVSGGPVIFSGVGGPGTTSLTGWDEERGEQRGMRRGESSWHTLAIRHGETKPLPLLLPLAQLPSLLAALRSALEAAAAALLKVDELRAVAV
jgi:hypothetical protein